MDLADEVLISQRMDAIARARGWDGPDWYACYDALRAEAEAALAAEAAGQVQTYRYRVVPGPPETVPGMPGETRYVALAPDDATTGCVHAVTAGSWPDGQALAIRAHEERCVGPAEVEGMPAWWLAGGRRTRKGS
jgi:hypothetical protein